MQARVKGRAKRGEVFRGKGMATEDGSACRMLSS